MTLAYLDPAALVDFASPGPAGQRVANVAASHDALATLAISEIEVPSLAGRTINRVGWAWIVNTVALVQWTDGMRDVALDLAWLGAPFSVAMHLACATSLDPDLVVTSSVLTASWAELARLPVALLEG